MREVTTCVVVWIEIKRDGPIMGGTAGHHLRGGVD